LGQDVVAGVGVGKPVEDDSVEFVGGEPVGPAFGGAVSVAGEAGVVPVAVLAAGRGAADEPRAAVGAADEPGEQVVRLVAGAAGMVLAPLVSRMRCAASNVSKSMSGGWGAGW
jgi:hypothetical protein